MSKLYIQGLSTIIFISLAIGFAYSGEHVTGVLWLILCELYWIRQELHND